MIIENGVPLELTHRILGCAIQVHQALGPGLLENAYRVCLLHSLKKEGLGAQTEVPIPIEFDGVKLDISYRADVIVDGKVLLELKAVDRILPIHTMQAVTYLQLAGLPVGLLVNFNVPVLMNGVKRLVRRPRCGVASRIPVSPQALP